MYTGIRNLVRRYTIHPNLSVHTPIMHTSTSQSTTQPSQSHPFVISFSFFHLYSQQPSCRQAIESVAQPYLFTHPNISMHPNLSINPNISICASSQPYYPPILIHPYPHLHPFLSIHSYHSAVDSFIHLSIKLSTKFVFLII